jgi:Fe-S-cluster containining protein
VKSVSDSEAVDYRCLNCGACCSNLIHDRQGVRKGLPLLPNETEIFLKSQIRPAYGIGSDPRDPAFKVIAYQMRLARCPHRRLGGCDTHAYRPAICRSYPYVPVISQGLRVVKTFDMTCTALAAARESYGNGMVPVLQSSVQTEAESYPLVASITERILEDVSRSWFYDLRTGRWISLTRMLPQGDTLMPVS